MGTGLFDLSAYHPAADGVTDDTAALARCLDDLQAAGGGTLTLPPGDYFLSGTRPLPLPSHTTVSAYGARFRLPERLGDRARVVLFAGKNLRDFSWFGGHFQGYCFDPRRSPHTWEPNANTRVFAFTTTRGGLTDSLTFRDLTADHIAGAVINVEGVGVEGSESEVDTFATHVTVRDCRFLDCGKFMWDYGLLWQMLVWPEEYALAEVDLAWRYFRQDLVRDGVGMRAGDDRVRFDNSRDPLPLYGQDDAGAVCFTGPHLPANVARGRQYCVVDSQPDYVRVAERPGGPALTFATAGGDNTRLIANLPQAFYHLYAPWGAGPGKGGVDLVCCRHTSLTGNVLSALGDTMHLQRCHDNVFAHNQITGSRMGAFFLAEYCRNSTVVGNTVDGTNGSRVMSVEKSSAETTITGNTFRHGGRGSWINQPQGIIFQGNIFVNNTTKCERDPYRGRKSYATGDYERYAEIYFTTHEPGGQYGPVIMRDNLFVTGPECAAAMSFAPGGHDLLIQGNVLTGPARTIEIAPECRNVHRGTNPGWEERP